MGARTTILGDRPVGKQFDGVKYAVEEHNGGRYGVRRAPCGCYHMLRLNEYGPTCDGSTNLCDEHAIPDEYEAEDETPLCPPSGWAVWNLAETPEFAEMFATERRGVGELLAFWAWLAARPDERYDETGMLCDALDAEMDLARQGKVRTLDEARDWADRVMLIRKLSESNPPNAGFREGDIEETIVLSWDGTWTQNRRVWIQLAQGNDANGSPCLLARVEWDTGTGQPSRFLADLAGTITTTTESGEFESEGDGQ